MPPTLYIKNALRLAELGLGDGTVYASAGGAAPNITQKTFALTGLTLIPDWGADSDDKLNGHLLYFPASGNRYHIVDWVALTATATVYENPASTDTGACEIRRGLVCNLQLAGNPAHFLADGQLFAKWKSAANTVIDVHMPNLIKNGGFESGGLSPWNGSFAGTGVIAINSITPILGAKDVRMNRGNQPNVILDQTTIEGFKKNRKYRLLFKARSAGAFVSGDLQVYFFDILSDAVLSNPSSGTITGGSVPNLVWLPILGGSNAWHSVDIAAPAWDNPKGGLRFTCNTAVDIFLDEVYLFEQVNVGALLIFDGIADNAATNPDTSCTGRMVTKNRTGQTAGVDNAVLLPAQRISGGKARLLEFTPAIYPIYTIESSSLIQAGEILLAEKWAWKFAPELPDDAERFEYNESIFRSRSGVVRRILHSNKRAPNMQLSFVHPVDVPIWLKDFSAHHLDPGHPFAAKWTGNWGDRPVLFRNTEPGFSLPRKSPNYPDKKLEWEEVL